MTGNPACVLQILAKQRRITIDGNEARLRELHENDKPRYKILTQVFPVPDRITTQ
jgi:hypothetical protein